MCVLFFANQVHSRHSLVFAGNRDEFYERPTAAAGWWDNHPEVLAGRDLEAGGTWLGITRAGRWSVVTNVRDLAAHRDRSRSRGDLVKDFLLRAESPESFANRIFREREDFNPFNLIVGESNAVWIVSTHTDAPAELVPGIYGLSNGNLDEPWPKVKRGKAAFEGILQADEPNTDSLLSLLHDSEQAPDIDLPDTGMGLEMERTLSPLFIASERYGTRASSLVLLNDNEGQFVERTYAAGGVQGGTVDLLF